MYFLLAYLLLKILLYTLFNEDKSEEKAKYIIILFLVSKIFKIFFFSVKAYTKVVCHHHSYLLCLNFKTMLKVYKLACCCVSNIFFIYI